MGQKAIKEEKEFKTQAKHFFGYLFPTNNMNIAMIGIFAALNCILTMIISIPIPATQGFINIGDAGVMITGMLLGPIIGGLAGGIGSALADLLLGYSIYAPATLVIKGLEGFIVGMISHPRINHSKLKMRDIVGVICGGLVMVFGYFLYEILLFGVPAALYESIFNGIIQLGLGAIIACIFIASTRKRIVDTFPQAFSKIYLMEV
ncbi:MAG: ECF transporter S component [Promethearchaeota archaeon]